MKILACAILSIAALLVGYLLGFMAHRKRMLLERRNELLKQSIRLEARLAYLKYLQANPRTYSRPCNEPFEWETQKTLGEQLN